MLLKRIEAQTMAAALDKARKECGDDALLIETGRSGDRYVVIASRRKPVDPTAPEPIAPIRFTKGFAPIAESALGFGLSKRVLTAVEKALIGTRVSLQQPGDPAVPTAAGRILKSLIRKAGFELPDWRVVTFIGPTGVGKTTTLAKLAARHSRDAGEQVALLTLDTYRVAAVEQLRAFADMLNVPLEVCFTPADMRRALEQHRSADRIFIDTSGRSPFDARSIEQLRGLLAGSRPKTALCLPASTRHGDGLATLHGFSTLKPDCLILTKWDETRMPGEALSLAIEQDLPISHVTVGQEVPDDILTADSGALAAAALCLEEPLAQTLVGAEHP